MDELLSVFIYMMAEYNSPVRVLIATAVVCVAAALFW